MNKKIILKSSVLTKLVVPEIQGETLEEIAIFKAKWAAKELKKSVIIEDTALCFDELKGLPGAYVKWFLSRLGPEGLIRLLPNEPNCTRSAQAICTMAYCKYQESQDLNVTIFQGICSGSITQLPRGDTKFGWDPIFQPDNSEKTFAEMTMTEKNLISHRSKALHKLKEFFTK